MHFCEKACCVIFLLIFQKHISVANYQSRVNLVLRYKTLNNISEKNNSKLKTYSPEEILSPEQVRKILNSDNRELQQLCKHGRIFPKKDTTTGKVFFLKEDLECLKKVKEAGLRSSMAAPIMVEKQTSTGTVLAEQPREEAKTMSQPTIEKTVLSSPQPVREGNNEHAQFVGLETQVRNALTVQRPINRNVALSESTSELNAIVDVVVAAKENVIERISKVVEEKLDGLDEIIVELINSKTETERLRDKINQLTKENYKLQEDIDKYKPVGLGLYLKK